MNEIPSAKSSDKPNIPFCQKLQSARENLGLDRKDIANQLRLNEKIIIMMEKDRYPSDLPATFIRGYIRSYGKLLQLPDFEIAKGIEHIKPRPQNVENIPNTRPLPEPVTSGNYLMQVLTFLILFTMIGLVGTWWYTHATQPPALPGLPAQIQENAPKAMLSETPSPAHQGKEVTSTPSKSSVINAEAPVKPLASSPPF